MSGTGRAERAKELLRRLVESNRPLMAEHLEAAREQRDLYGRMDAMEDYALMLHVQQSRDLPSYLNHLPEVDLAELEAVFAGVLRVMGQDAGGGPEARQVQYNSGMEDFEWLFRLGTTDFRRLLREWVGSWEVFQNLFPGNLRQTAWYLRDRLDDAERYGGRRKGDIARELRWQIRGMGIEALFKEAPAFMNETLRDFLNLKEDGTGNYVWDDMEGNGWSEFSSFGSQMHQATASPEMVFLNAPVVPEPGNYYTRLNAKFVNDDGREAVFNYRRQLITDYPDKGTFNYFVPEDETAIGREISTGASSLPGRMHSRWDIDPYNELMKTSKHTAVLRRLKAENGPLRKSNPWMWGNSRYWQFDAGNGGGRQ